MDRHHQGERTEVVPEAVSLLEGFGPLLLVAAVVIRA
jgi:hypothetical protein